ncbi:MAG: hypothetical protein R3Y62_08415 [Eubacteriales bacterium]
MEVGLLQDSVLLQQKPLIAPAIYQQIVRGTAVAMGVKNEINQVVSLVVYRLQPPFCQILQLLTLTRYRRMGYATLLLSQLTAYFQLEPAISQIVLSLPVDQLGSDIEGFCLRHGFAWNHDQGQLIWTTLGDLRKNEKIQPLGKPLSECLRSQVLEVLQLTRNFLDVDSEHGFFQDYDMDLSVVITDKKGVSNFALMASRESYLELSLLYCHPEAIRGMMGLFTQLLSVASVNHPPETALRIVARTPAAVSICEKLFETKTAQNILQYSLYI